MTYSFRLKFKLSERQLLDVDSGKWVIDNSSIDNEVVIRSLNGEKAINESCDLVLCGKGYHTFDEAITVGLQYQDLLIIAFSNNLIGADFGNRILKGGWTTDGLKMLEEKSGLRILNDNYGLVAYVTEPNLFFSSFSAKGVVLKSHKNLKEVIVELLSKKPNVTAKERLAYDLFSSSFFQQSVDARFLMLMMAIETLIEQKERLNDARDLIDELIRIAHESSIQSDERSSIVKSLEQLYFESIGQAGRRLASCLGDRKYKNSTPKAFFNDCYRLRSALVHGASPRSSIEEINSYVGELERFVGDLICYPHLNVSSMGDK